MTRIELHTRLQTLKVRRDIGELAPTEYAYLYHGAIAAYKEDAKARKAARRCVQTALERGDLRRPECCEGCGTCGFLITAHHSDYSKPLAVRWLCWSDHKEADKVIT